jgi:hypothetical protein
VTVCGHREPWQRSCVGSLTSLAADRLAKGASALAGPPGGRHRSPAGGCRALRPGPRPLRCRAVHLCCCQGRAGQGRAGQRSLQRKMAPGRPLGIMTFIVAILAASQIFTAISKRSIFVSYTTFSGVGALVCLHRYHLYPASVTYVISTLSHRGDGRPGTAGAESVAAAADHHFPLAATQNRH